MGESRDCTKWVARIIRERGGFERKLREANKLLNEAMEQVEELKLKVKELEERLASKSTEIKFSSN